MYRSRSPEETAHARGCIDEQRRPAHVLWGQIRAWANAAARRSVRRTPRPALATEQHPPDPAHELLRRYLAQELGLRPPKGPILSSSQACRLACDLPAPQTPHGPTESTLHEVNRLCRQIALDSESICLSHGYRRLGWMPSISELGSGWLWTVSPIYPAGTRHQGLIGSAGMTSTLEVAFVEIAAFLERD